MITAKLSGKRIVVSENGDSPRSYSFPAGDPARNQYGYETGNTWEEEFVQRPTAIVVGQEDDGDMVAAVWVNE